MTRALKLHASLLSYLWQECILAASLATHQTKLQATTLLEWDTPYIIKDL